MGLTFSVRKRQKCFSSCHLWFYIVDLWRTGNFSDQQLQFDGLLAKGTDLSTLERSKIERKMECSIDSEKLGDGWRSLCRFGKHSRIEIDNNRCGSQVALKSGGVIL
jgi:hypothetical protein